MTRRRKVVLFSAATLVVLGVLALPGVHWRIIGWARGEPFHRARPASYYANRLRSWHDVQPSGVFVSWGPEYNSKGYLCTPAEAWVRRNVGHRAANLVWDHAWAEWLCEPGAVPVLIALLDHHDPAVRYVAVENLGRVGPSAQPALPQLRRLADDHFGDQSSPYGLTVAHAATTALRKIDPNP